ncbi:ribosome hibernation-promoting factor, HPF/YfiA family [Motilimonas pumila]|uniref:Ribosome-associated translation inhibitor RaiA n=1 Tax=Motilimonas pumila TaxID=2303987 RepID=A0A418YKC4_9GAMM|nr:ribosome-associated translation inhibitor RaiA [Motilimonas pumila]RJG51280.1 ribosome-associated translation inhibitor RaiA [Motilimonas pumila]
MTVEITSKHVTITTPMREKVQARFDKLEKHQLPLIKPHFIITQEPKGFKIEGVIGVPNGKLFATANDADLYKAINALGQKLEKQLIKHIDKPEAKRHIKQAQAPEPSNDNEEAAA